MARAMAFHSEVEGGRMWRSLARFMGPRGGRARSIGLGRHRGRGVGSRGEGGRRGRGSVSRGPGGGGSGGFRRVCRRRRCSGGYGFRVPRSSSPVRGAKCTWLGGSIETGPGGTIPPSGQGGSSGRPVEPVPAGESPATSSRGRCRFPVREGGWKRIGFARSSSSARGWRAGSALIGAARRVRRVPSGVERSFARPVASPTEPAGGPVRSGRITLPARGAPVGRGGTSVRLSVLASRSSPPSMRAARVRSTGRLGSRRSRRAGGREGSRGRPRERRGSSVRRAHPLSRRRGGASVRLVPRVSRNLQTLEGRRKTLDIVGVFLPGPVGRWGSLSGSACWPLATGPGSLVG